MSTVTKYGLSGLASAFAITIGLAVTPMEQALAQTTPDATQTAQRQQVLKYANGNFLAYIPSINAQANDDTKNGMGALQEALTKRTTLDPDSEIVALNLDSDTLIPFKFIYWPIAPEDTNTISAEAQQKIQDFISQGGVILFDTIGTSDASVEERIKKVIGDVNLGIIETFNKDHALNISYYRIEGFPEQYRNNGLTGAFNSRPIYVQRPDDRKADSISSIIIGDQREWARAMAGRGVYPEAKEYALKSIMNVVLSAYGAGNYKLDQSKILETLERVQRP